MPLSAAACFVPHLQKSKTVPLDRSLPSAPAEVLAVVVCYYPNLDGVVTLARRLLASGHADVLFIDNTESHEACARLRKAVAELSVSVICCGTNAGVAEAHNIGLRIARKRGNKAVLLLDQDTQLQEDTLACLLETYRCLRDRGERVAGVGASFVDPRNGYAFPFVRLGRMRMHAVASAKTEPVECDLLISSGSLIPVDAVNEIGEMDESLFIDYVDMEWCARARAGGWKVFGVPAAHMHHTIGERTIRLLGRVIAVHKPERQYYLIRNALLFARKPYLPLNWRAHLVYRAVTQLAMFSLLTSPRGKRVRWMARGFWDGLRGHGGRLDRGTVFVPTPRATLLRSAPEEVRHESRSTELAK